MAFNFSLTMAEGMSKLKQDSQGRASLQVVVKDVSGRPLDGWLVPISLPKGAQGVVEKGLVKVEKADRHFDVDKEETFSVRLIVPPNFAPGEYSFRLDAVWVDQPDQSDSSSAIGFSVAAKEKKETSILVWLIPLLVVVVIVLGVGAWLLLKPSGPTVPDLHGQSVSDAVNTLASVGLTLDQNNVQSVESKPEDSDKIISQKPDTGQRATKGQAVQVTVGEQVVRVPMLVGHPFSEVMAILGKSLTVGQTVTAQNPNFAGGVVFAQNPPADKAVKSGTSVDLQVTPQMVTVPNVSGQTLGNAILALRGLTVTSFSGDTTKTVISQNPGQGASVPVGSSVTLAFPPGACVVARCFYDGIFAKRVASELALRAREIQQRST